MRPERSPLKTGDLRPFSGTRGRQHWSFQELIVRILPIDPVHKGNRGLPGKGRCKPQQLRTKETNLSIRAALEIIVLYRVVFPPAHPHLRSIFPPNARKANYKPCRKNSRLEWKCRAAPIWFIERASNVHHSLLARKEKGKKIIVH